jgi:N-acetylglucosaminyldiphosphoundecaprenol N-acetyl-beta-D-mannosaminyltransferase
MIDQGKKSVLGVMVDAVDYDAAVDRVRSAACERRPMLCRPSLYMV